MMVEADTCGALPWKDCSDQRDSSDLAMPPLWEEDTEGEPTLLFSELSGFCKLDVSEDVVKESCGLCPARTVAISESRMYISAPSMLGTSVVGTCTSAGGPMQLS